MGQPFFVPEDFAALRRDRVRSENPAVIAARKSAAERLRALHRGHLARFMSDRGLHPHPNSNFWTNVFFPKWEANGEWVDYLRFGYGKEGRLVREMADRAGFVRELTPLGTTDHMAFHYVAQVQLGLTCDYWWFNFYVDDKAWLEQVNLLEKVKQPAQRRMCVALLQDLIDQGFELRIWSTQERGVTDHARETPEEFLEDLARYRRDRLAINVDIEQRFDPDNPANDTEVLPGLARRQFEALLPLYRFWSWHPTANHYIPGL
ncbi:MAG TPA: hypothetical protein VD973_28000 [Symbiobacteriaceae bacterium]|nr:hypothetical protein [Symbiobacteriaceae bacterium]